MKNKTISIMRRIFGAAALLSAFAVTTSTSLAQNSIGINFAGRQWSIGGQTPQTLTYTDYAGAVVQQNWNNVDLGGHDSGGLGQIIGPNAGVLSDNSGAATGLSFTYSAQGMWSMNQQNGLTGNQQLMNGYSDVENTNNGTYGIGNITYSLYDVYVYITADGNGRLAGVSINGGASHYLLTGAAGYNFSNPLLEGAATTSAGATNAHYVCFRSVSGDSLQIAVSRDASNIGVAAIQIVDKSGTVYQPSFAFQPTSKKLYAGGTARFVAAASGTAPFTYCWQKNGVNLSDAGNVSGSTSNVLTISNVTAANVASYTLVVSNIAGFATSTPVQLDVVTPVGAYEQAIVSDNPVAYYRLNDLDNPVFTPNAQAFDYVGGANGVYGMTVDTKGTGTQGPQPIDGFPGFEADNGAASFGAYFNTSQITLPSLGITTNAVTLTGWIYPTETGTITANSGIIFNRGVNVAGLNYSSNTNADGNLTLGYNWNNDGGAYGWNSGLVPPRGLWSFVALVVTPSDATIYLANTNGIASSVHSYAHVNQSFNAIAIGNDPFDPNSGDRVFNGKMDEVAVFNKALTQSQVIALFTSASGMANFPPSIAVQPSPQSPYAQQTARFSVSALGTAPLNYQWQVQSNGVFVNVPNGGRISGANGPTLTISNVSVSDSANYTVIVNNVFNSVTSSPASLNVTASSYANAVMATGPMAYYSFNETGDPASGSVTAYDYVGGFNGVYGTHVKNGNPAYGVAGPLSADGFPSFPGNNTAAKTTNGANGHVTVAPWTINTNTVTFTAWIRPDSVPGSWSGIVFCRGGGMSAGLNFNGSLTGNGNRILSFTWGNNSGWNSQLAPPTNQWSFVGLVISPTNASIYMINTNGIKIASTPAANAVQNFAGTATLGCDPYDLSGRNFSGAIDEAAVYNRSLSTEEMVYLYTHGTGVGMVPQVTMLTPSVVAGYPGMSVTITASVVGSGPFTYAWYRGATLLNNGGNVSGANSLSLTISNVSASDAGDYKLIVTGSAGSTPSTLSTLNVGTVPSNPYHSTVLAANPFAYWRLNETSGTVAHDSIGGHDGTYGSAMNLGAPGQQGAGMFGVAADTTAARFTANTDQSWVTVPALNLNTNTVTIMAWVYPTLRPDSWSGIFLTKSPGGAGLTFRDNTPNTLGMMWNDGAFWYSGTSLTVPVNQWSLVALSVEPTMATLYVMNSSGTNSWVNNAAMNVEPWNGVSRIGNDSYAINRTFNGYINEVAVFNRTLSGTELGAFYSTAATAQLAPITLQIQKNGTSVNLIWTGGTLYESDTVNGTWTPVQNALSPRLLTPGGASKFYRVIR